MLTRETLARVADLYANVEKQRSQFNKADVQQHLSVNAKDINGCLDSIEGALQKERTVILHDYLDKLQEASNKLGELREDLDHNFLLFVMGSGKNGKSTLINALLGQKQAKENTLPETWKIDIFRKADNGGVKFKYKDGREISYSWQQADEVLLQEEKAKKEAKAAIRAELREFKKTGAPIEAQEEKKKYLLKYKMPKSSITEAVWPVESSQILEQYRLVDTPGLRQELDDMVISSAKEYYQKADGVIWVLPGDKIAARSDKTEIEELQKQYGRRRDNMVAVINRLDVVLESGHTVDGVLSEAKKLYGDVFSEFIPISSKQAREAQEILNNPESTPDQRQQAMALYKQSNMPALMSCLERTIFANSLNIQIASKIKGADGLYGDIRQTAKDAAELLEEMDGKRKKKLADEENDAKALRKNLLKECKNFIKQDVKRVCNLVDDNEDYLWNLEADERNAEIQEYIDAKQVEKKIKNLVDKHCKKIQKLYQQHVALAPFKEFTHLENSLSVVVQNREGKVGNTELGSLGDGMGTSAVVVTSAVVMGGLALLGPVGLLFGALSFTDFGKSVIKFFAKLFRDKLSNKVGDAYSSKLEEIFDVITDDYANNWEKCRLHIDKLREGTFEELYGSSDVTPQIVEYLRAMDKEYGNSYQEHDLTELIFGRRNYERTTVS